MSEASIAPNRFWHEFKSDVADSFSTEQRAEIERVLNISSKPDESKVSNLRLSFKWFFVRLAWGPERRNRARIKHEQETDPALAPRNLPMLASLFAGYVGMVFVALVLASWLLYYLIS